MTDVMNLLYVLFQFFTDYAPASRQVASLLVTRRAPLPAAEQARTQNQVARHRPTLKLTLNLNPNRSESPTTLYSGKCQLV